MQESAPETDPSRSTARGKRGRTNEIPLKGERCNMSVEEVVATAEVGKLNRRGEREQGRQRSFEARRSRQATVVLG